MQSKGLVDIHCNDRHSTTMQSQDIAATGFPCGHRPSRGANFRQQKRRMTPMRSGGSFVTGNPSAARSSLKSIICLAPHAKQTVGRHPLQRQAFDNDAVAGSKNVVSRNKPLQNWMLEFFCSHGVEPCSANEDLAGSTDLAVCLPAGALALIDWKRSDKLRKRHLQFWWHADGSTIGPS